MVWWFLLPTYEFKASTVYCRGLCHARGGERGVSRHGPVVPPWSGRRVSEALAWVKAKGRKAGTPCCICSQGIDYSLEYPHPQSCSVQHLKSRKAFPQLTWERSNWEPSHLSCNQAAGIGPALDLGATSFD